MKKVSRCGVLLLFFFILAGCSSNKEDEAADYHLYYINIGETRLVPTKYVPETRTTATIVDEVMELVQKPIKGEKYLNLLPKGVTVLGYQFENQLVTVNLSQSYQELKDTESTREILVRAGFVKNLVQIPGVTNVAFLIEGQPMKDNAGNDIGYMKAESFVENEGKNINSYVYTTLNLYFTNETGDKLIKEAKKVYYSSNVPLEKVVVEQLMRGPKEEGLYPTIPVDTQILGVSISEGVCYVNLDKAFASPVLNVRDQVPVYSVVQSIIDACHVEKVQISIDGETKVKYRETLDLDRFFTLEDVRNWETRDE